MKKIFLAVLLLLLGCYSLWQLSSARSFQVFGELVQRVDTTEKIIALTFDDGPSRAYTDEVLGLLAHYDVHATFFLTGKEMAANPEHTRRLLASGHQLANHSFSHPRMVLMSQTAIAKEIEQTDLLIRQAGYQGDIVFRPPYGKKLLGLPWYLKQQNRLTVMWDLEPESDAALAKDAEAMAQYVIDNAKLGSIILLHVMYQSRQSSRDALPLIITGLQQQGYRFVTVNALLAKRQQNQI